MPTDTFPEARFGIIVQHPAIRELVLLVLGPQGNDAVAMVLADDSAGDLIWPTGRIEIISRAGWIILDEGIE